MASNGLESIADLLRIDPEQDKVDAITIKMSNKMRIVRKKGVDMLYALLKDCDDATVARLESMASDLCKGERWELRQSGFLAAKALMPRSTAPFRAAMLKASAACVEDEESRVRLAVAELLQGLTKEQGIEVYLTLKDIILKSIEDNFVRDDEAQALKDLEENAKGDAHVPQPSVMPDSPQLHGHSHSHGAPVSPLGSRRGSTAPLGKHDTEGWKSLETSFTALRKIMMGAGAAFAEHLTPSLLGLVYRSVKHTNRFVRETGYFICGTISQTLEEEQLKEISEAVTKVLAFGLGDNWSQVRYAASVATRKFMLASPSFREDYYPRLVPPMCLNRYYVAAGVRLFSIESWRLIMGDTGKEVVANCIKEVVEYYIVQSQADNHAVREAGCHCIAELGAKVDKQAVEPFVPQLLAALLDCFKDESWPVRDAACCACGNFVASFPDASRPCLDELYKLWFAHLADNIPSVREGSAVALGQVARAYGQPAIDVMLPKLREMLPRVKEQQSDSQKYGSLTNTTTFGVAAKKKRDNDDALHTNQQVYSCGSLAPKLRRGGGCMDHSFRRASEPWESTDGAVYLIRELASIQPECIPEFMPMLSEVARCKHFAHHQTLQETIWTNLPEIARGMGKKPFKRVMQEFLEPMFHTLECQDSRLAMNAAGMCILALNKFVGPMIFDGRINSAQREAMKRSPYCREVPKTQRGAHAPMGVPGRFDSHPLAGSFPGMRPLPTNEC